MPKKWRCQCELCTKWWPLLRRVEKKLSGRDRKLFEQWQMKIANDSDSLGAATAKLNGDWPDWEWMKQAVKDHIKDWS